MQRAVLGTTLWVGGRQGAEGSGAGCLPGTRRRRSPAQHALARPTRAKRSRAIRAVRPGGIPTACTARATGTKRRLDTPPKSSNPESVRLFASDCERAVATGEKTAYSGALLCGRVASNMRHDDSPQIRRTYVHAPTYMWCIGRPQDDAGGLMRTHRAGGSAHAPTGSMGGRRSHTESQDHCANDQTGKVTR
jgi:hypothetical protein